MTVSLLGIRNSIVNQRRPFDYHHIIPQSALACSEAREILSKVDIGINSEENKLFDMWYSFHICL